MNMKKLLLLCLSLVMSSFVMAQLSTPRTSPQASVSQTVGISKITVNYSRPNVINPQGQDRTGKVWGELVPFGFTNYHFGTSTAAPWRAGADESTTIEFSHDAFIEGETIPAGKYGLFMAVEENGEVTVIFNKRNTDWGSYFYIPEEDALRVRVNSVENNDTPLLTYHFPRADDKSAVLALDWEKKRIPVSINFDTPELVYYQMKNELQGDKGFSYLTWQQGARFLANHNIHLDEALQWANNAVEGQFYSLKNFQTLETKATVLKRLGKTDEADLVFKEALEHPTAFINNYYTYGRELIAEKKTKEALEVFKAASKKWSDHWLAPHGLARGYSAIGDSKAALKQEKKALLQAPEGSKQFIEAYIKTLEEGKDFN